MALKLFKNRIFWYYFFLIAGGLWNYLGWFKDIMKSTSGYVMILIALISLLEIKTNSKPKFLIFSLFIVISSMYFEYIGTTTGLLFGQYHYTNLLQPQLHDLPIAIGAAWLSSYLISASIISRFNGIIFILCGSLLMTILDIFLEPTAIKLNYWQWENSTPPLFNYITWFGLSFFYFSLQSLFKIKINSKKLIHLYLAQLSYFILSIL
jgi:putative membrane protein